MKYKTIEEIEARRAEIRSEMEKEGADLDSLEAEVRTLKENETEIRNAAETAKETRKRIAAGLEGTVLASQSSAPAAAPSLDEIRASKEYVDAYARYIITEDDTECRALLTTNAPANGQMPVPTLVDTIIRTAWEKDKILSRVRRTDFRGNVSVPFEISADPAQEHLEGQEAIDEEDVALGVVSLIPKNIKKFIRVSDELLDMGGEPMLRYVYDELTHQIIKLLVVKVIGDIADAADTDSTTAIGIPAITGAPDLVIVPNAEAHLTDEAEDVVVIINRLTSAAFTSARVAGNFAVDPYDGLVVLYTSALPAYATAASGKTWMIVGDLKAEQVNYPNGDGVVLKFDDLSEAEADMVKVHGRQYAAHGVTAPGCFVNVKKA